MNTFTHNIFMFYRYNSLIDVFVTSLYNSNAHVQNAVFDEDFYLDAGVDFLVRPYRT